MKSNPKTIAGVIVLVVLAIAFGFLLSRLLPAIGEVRREMSLTPTPEPAWPASVQQITRDPSLPTPEPVLRTGSRGQEVKDVQTRLYQLGYYTDEIDGQFGSATKAAVIEFQKANGLDADGMVGSETKAILFSSRAKPKTGE